MQEIWTTGIQWDEPLPPHIQNQWMTLREQLPSLNELALPRCLLSPGKNQSFQLHLFTDASESAYAAAVYSRFVDENGVVTTRLLASKSRVAPVKQISLPRLELCAAHLGCKLIKIIEELLHLTKFQNYEVFAWSDSTIVLQWIAKLPRKWTTFVANRVAIIQDTISPDKWNHVPTTSNPADLPSRGMSPVDLRKSALWWYGPP